MIRYLIVFKDKVDFELLKDARAFSVESFNSMDNIAICELDATGYRKLKGSPSVKSIEQDNTDKLSETSDTSGTQGTSYAYDFMNVAQFHAEGITGSGVKVAILDTGIQQHEDLVIAGGYNAYDESLPYDSDLASFHGTKVAGVVGMQDNDVGYIGVAPGVSLYAVRIDDGSGSINRTLWSAQIKAIDWCIANGMDAINCSFSSSTDSAARKEAFRRAYDAGIAIFCSAGNTQPAGNTTTNTVVFPSKYPFVVTTANIASDKQRYTSSSIGRGINFANGGTSIVSSNIDSSKAISDQYQAGTGTSYASPATLGMYALYKEKYGESRDKTLQRMYLNAENLGNELFYGAGIPKYPTENYDNIQIRG